MSELVRMEKDVMGLVTVSAQALWGASTQRALGHFDISTERMPLALLMALADIKKIGASQCGFGPAGSHGGRGHCRCRRRGAGRCA